LSPSRHVYGGITNKANFEIDRRQLSTLVYVAVVANILGDIAYFFALTQVLVTNAVVIGYVQPIFIAMMGFLVLREEKLSRFDQFGIAAMVTAGLLIVAQSLGNLLALRLGTYGDLVVLSARVAWSTTTIVVRKYLRQLNAGVITLLSFPTCVSSACGLPCILFRPWSSEHVSGHDWNCGWCWHNSIR
jgi:drug/metabolite transporter (DMT)-like permease